MSLTEIKAESNIGIKITELCFAIDELQAQLKAKDETIEKLKAENVLIVEDKLKVLAKNIRLISENENLWKSSETLRVYLNESLEETGRLQAERYRKPGTITCCISREAKDAGIRCGQPQCGDCYL